MEMPTQPEPSRHIHSLRKSPGLLIRPTNSSQPVPPLDPPEIRLDILELRLRLLQELLERLPQLLLRRIINLLVHHLAKLPMDLLQDVLDPLRQHLVLGFGVLGDGGGELVARDGEGGARGFEAEVRFEGGEDAGFGSFA